MPRQTVVRNRITERTAIPDDITVSRENPPNASMASAITVRRGTARTNAPLARYPSTAPALVATKAGVIAA